MIGRFPFNVRVYGLLVEQGRVLVSVERVQERMITKFPGGGLEFGEGPEDCVVREWMEELAQKVEVQDHFYTTGFFQRSAFRKEEQVISIYYLVKNVGLGGQGPTESISDGPEEQVDSRWLDLEKALGNEVTLPIDQHVLRMLKGYTGESRR